MKKRDQRTRVIKLLHILQRQTDEEHPLNATQLAAELLRQGVACDRKTIYADLAALEKEGYDIIYSHARPTGYFLASRLFETAEVGLLADAVLSADFITRKKTRELTQKLSALLNNFKADELKTRFCFFSKDKTANEQIYYNIDALRQAIRQKAKVTLGYQRHLLQNGTSPQKTTRELTVSPYAMLWANDHYYLVCNYQKYNNLMHLRLDRIVGVTPLTEPARPFSEVSEYTTTFDIADYAAKTFNMFGGEPATVKLQCKAELLEQILDRFGEDLYIQKCSEESFIFTAKARLSEGLTGWILQFGSGITVLQPASLAAAVTTAAKELLKNYKSV